MKDLRRIKTKQDIRLIAKWLQKRGMTLPNSADISTYGYIADDRVACWLQVTDGSTALVEGLISDPDSIPSLRWDSMVKLVGFLVDAATSMGFTKILFTSDHPSVERLAKMFGAKKSKMPLYELDTDMDRSNSYRKAEEEFFGTE